MMPVSIQVRTYVPAVSTLVVVAIVPARPALDTHTAEGDDRSSSPENRFSHKDKYDS